MTTLATAEVAESKAVHGFWTRSSKAGIAYVVLGLVAAWLGTRVDDGADAVFKIFWTGSDIEVKLPAAATVFVLAALCVLAGATLISPAGRNLFGWGTGVALVGFTLAFVCFSIAKPGVFLPVTATMQGALFLALPLILGALCGVLCERSGVINVAIEGQFLVGAFTGALIGTLTASAWAGLIAGALAGCLIGLFLAVLAIRYLVDQVVLGVVLNLLALGLTGFLYERIMQQAAEKYNAPPKLGEWTIPLLSKIPVIGPALFDQNIFTYFAIALVVIVYVALFHTPFGLRTRAVGEHPAAADSVGVRVNWVRFRNVLMGGLIAGVGGAFFTIGSAIAFNKNMTVGKGFIALAVLIVGRWNPIGALLGALLFGFTDQLQIFLSSMPGGSPIPSQFLSMLPYIVTIFAVAGLVGKVRAPAADGVPYVKS
ncbi:ABC transporter permease [Phytomonospora endophytica]|uniref:Simple sugar transport system permease protein n=1 Tax=Phytomonospora endophytica TaxID=714109 RepID=A0A841FJK8_9ACTN|nr:ABC transporter permease [Phytomonospora endophytica]MBB6033337.1 simple sugar transport system permease protein [Phytomonospora endophytica]GIG71502.1 ABC transporter permease [Phytomonospora endophytica]